MRNLNLSYNRINYEGGDKDQKEYGEQFMKNMKDFAKNAPFVNHINFSGMAFTTE